MFTQHSLDKLNEFYQKRAELVENSIDTVKKFSKAEKDQVACLIYPEDIWDSEAILTHMPFHAWNQNLRYNKNRHECDYFSPLQNRRITFPTVTHAEENLLLSVLTNRAFDSHKNYVMVVSRTPCWNCARLIVQSQLISKIYVVGNDSELDFKDDSTGGISVREFLVENNITVKTSLRRYVVRVNLSTGI